MTVVDRSTKIYVAGHSGMVGGAIERALNENGPLTIVSRSHAELDLTNQFAVREFFTSERPDQVYLAAAKVGGINSNDSYPADFIYQNLMIQTNVINAAFEAGVKKLLFLGSSCIYPKHAAQPMSEEALLTGKLEPSNEPYAIAKIAGIKMCESYNRQYGDSHQLDYRCVMPTNLYGVGDTYHPENSHVIPGLIWRFHEAKVKDDPYVIIWGSGSPMREFLHCDDLARACVRIMNLSKSVYRKITTATCSHVNIGSGHEVSISELAFLIREVTGYTGDVRYDNTKPDGSPRKLMDSSRLRGLGWSPEVELKAGLIETYKDFQARQRIDS